VEFEFRPIDESSARAVLAWRYAPPYDVYNAAPGGVALAALLDPDNHYLVALRARAVVGFCCFGPDARVAGGDYSAEALDVGAGLRPDLTGRGSGAAFLGAVVALAARHAGARRLRATVAAFNVRALQACARVGFREAGRFRRPADDGEFVILLRAAEPTPAGAG
jgi:ribosomal-protein-alanine N-acetyltransferase